ncbi:type II toxin-antitoxin system HicA family toxin [Salinibacter ruber]|uniref:type II toxin-antitoxin system HicA family toxin n=1 Tax=Salinibacter ruber TaxID=146919 RepID=UPI0021698B07|nr:type II toxin-antitoxin system HicA family toxin [Salinibacter ruber]MCS4173323.1 putative RNA binding protein YcfA (HicA-like mRNA interferase family) [Salinibacter ruber]
MAASDLPTLRDELPRVFEDHEPPAWWDDHYVIPVETGDEADFDIGGLSDNLLEAAGEGITPGNSKAPPSPEEAFQSLGQSDRTLGENESPLQIETDETFPGSPRRQEGADLPPPDSLAFYLPFHFYYPDLWGVYLEAVGIIALAQYLRISSGWDPEEGDWKLSRKKAEAGARLFLYYHEAFHHKVESMATRLEVTHRQPLYKRGFLDLYRRALSEGDCTEEALASAHAFQKVTSAFKEKDWMTRAVRAGLRKYLESLPNAYRGAIEIIEDGSFSAVRNSFAEENHQESLPIVGKDEALWDLFGYAFAGITRINSYTNYIVRRGSTLADRVDLHSRQIGYGEVKNKLAEMVGLRFKRQGSGSHEIYETSDGNSVTLYYTSGDIPKGTLNSILKQADIDMSVHDFIRTRV